MNKLKRLAVLACLCASAGLASAQPAQVQDGIEVKPLPAYRTLASEEQLDQQAQLQYAGMLAKARQKGALAGDDDAQLIRLRAIARRIMPYASRWNPAAAQWRWQVNLIGSPEVNAFCMPGGRIGVFSGILSTLKLTDDEAAAIMGHEIAHALREHGRERMVQSTGVSMVSRIVGAGLAAWLGIDPGITGALADGVSQLAVLKFSRDDEREADLIGLDLAARAGFDPRAGVALWQKMAALNKRTPVALLSTHPGGSERIGIMNEHMNVLLPLYARSKGTTPDKLPAYRGAQVR
ncbi:MAG: M48 family metallopeptidase [Telluria sp.]|nr:M48 family metallopeptidase [Telluria sp.]